MDRLTAAHQTLPFHTLVEVENLDNGQRVLVRINDRGPFVKNRVIDLSRKAATRLDMLERGTAPVRLRLMDPVSGPAAAGEPPSIAGACLQAGAFSDRANAEARRDEIGSLLSEVSFRVVSADGLFKVVSENLPSLERARAVQRLLDSLGISSFLRAPIDAREQPR